MIDTPHLLLETSFGSLPLRNSILRDAFPQKERAFVWWTKYCAACSLPSARFFPAISFQIWPNCWYNPCQLYKHLRALTKIINISVVLDKRNFVWYAPATVLLMTDKHSGDSLRESPRDIRKKPSLGYSGSSPPCRRATAILQFTYAVLCPARVSSSHGQSTEQSESNYPETWPKSPSSWKCLHDRSPW